jgi:hypothetical protein
MIPMAISAAIGSYSIAVTPFWSLSFLHIIFIIILPPFLKRMVHFRLSSDLKRSSARAFRSSAYRRRSTPLVGLHHFLTTGRTDTVGLQSASRPLRFCPSGRPAPREGAGLKSLRSLGPLWITQTIKAGCPLLNFKFVKNCPVLILK